MDDMAFHLGFPVSAAQASEERNTLLVSGIYHGTVLKSCLCRSAGNPSVESGEMGNGSYKEVEEEIHHV